MKESRTCAVPIGDIAEGAFGEKAPSDMALLEAM